MKAILLLVAALPLAAQQVKPVLEYSNYLGGPGYDVITAVTTDRSGAAYVTGITTSANLPAKDVAQTLFGGATDGFVAKFSGADGSLLWVTYLGGRGTDTPNSIVLDPQGNIYVGGDTTSDNFPAHAAVQPNFGGGFDDAFVTKLSPNGERFIFSTYLGGSAADFGNGMAVHSDGTVYITGWTTSRDFPVRNAFQSGPVGGGADTFVTKLSSSGGTIVYSTYVGGESSDLGTGLAVDAAGSAYVTGTTESALFPVMRAVQPRKAGASDAFLYKLTPEGNNLVFATFLGGSGEDLGYRIAIDAEGRPLLSGYTKSADFPVRNAAQAKFGGATDVFVTKFAADGSTLLFSTYIGGTGEEFGFGNIVLDNAGSAYVSGSTASPDFPQRNPSQPAYGGGPTDAFVTRLSPEGDRFLYSSYLGGRVEDRALGVALDLKSGIHVVGGSSSPDFPRAANEYHPGLGGFDGFIARLSPDAPAATSVPVPLITADGIRHGATLRAGPFAPGQIVVIYGENFGSAALLRGALNEFQQLPTSLAETRVLVDGAPIQLLYVQRGQLGAFLPPGVSGRETVTLEVEYRSVRSRPVGVPVANSAPGLFTADGSGAGQAALLNQDGSLNSAGNPAAKGSIVVLYGTGFAPAQAPVSVEISGINAEVLYAGPAPGSTFGLTQLNARVPEGAASGNVSVVVRSGSASSSPGVTLSVR